MKFKLRNSVRIATTKKSFAIHVADDSLAKFKVESGVTAAPQVPDDFPRVCLRIVLGGRRR